MDPTCHQRPFLADFLLLANGSVIHPFACLSFAWLCLQWRISMPRLTHTELTANRLLYHSVSKRIIENYFNKLQQIHLHVFPCHARLTKKMLNNALTNWPFDTLVLVTLDRAIQRINHYPLHKCYQNLFSYSDVSDLSSGYLVPATLRTTGVCMISVWERKQKVSSFFHRHTVHRSHSSKIVKIVKLQP